MAHGKNYFASLFGGKKYELHRTERGIRIDVNFQPLGRALDKAQIALDERVWYDMQKYMPKREGSGHLIAQTNKLNQIAAGTGEVHVYDPAVEYAHYQYEGIKYVDPVYRVGGFYGILEGKEGQWWSRRGVQKVPSGEPLFYTNPMAEAHWDDVTIANHGREWVDVVKEALEEYL